MADEYNNQNIPQNDPEPQQNTQQDYQTPNTDNQQYQAPPQQDYQQQYQAPQQQYQTPPQQDYQQQNNQQYNQQYNQQAPNQQFYPPYQPPQEQKASVGFAILSYIIPLAGLVIYLTQKDKRPKTAKVSGICALVSFILNTLIVIIMYAVMGAALFSAADDYTDYSYGDDSYYSDYYDDYYDDTYDETYDDTYYEFYG